GVKQLGAATQLTRPTLNRRATSGRPASGNAAPVTRRMVPSGDQCRCSCGSMFARMVRDGLELKSRKCKSLVLITHDELIAMYRELDFQPQPFPPPPPEP